MRQLDLIGSGEPPRSSQARPPVRTAPEVQLGLFRDSPDPADARAEVAAEVIVGSDEPSPPAASEAKITIKKQVRVEAFLRSLIGPKVMVQLTENRSTMVSYSRKKGVLYVRLHAIFGDAPDHVLGAVGCYVTENRPGPKVGWMIDQWIEAHRHLVKKEGRGLRILPRGEVHDLKLIYDRLNTEYFRDRVKSRITWSVAAKKQRRSSIRMGSYSEDEQLIRIHPALDQAFVPEYFVASQVFHEMLHELHGAHEAADGTRRVHTPAFRKDEAKFRDFQKARAWEAQNLPRLLRY
ncbi:MAG: hypothetical protein AAFU79_16375 [Myxococcota bacterium]